MPLELLIAGLLAQGPTFPAPTLPLSPGDRVVVADEQRSIRGRIAEIATETLVLENDANIDPRLTLLGALVDAAIDRRHTVYRAGTAQTPITMSAPPSRAPREVFVRFGSAGLSDDEGSLGTGATVGAGVIVPLGRRFAAQIAYDRHTHERMFETAAPPGVPSNRRGFTGTEQLVTGKALIFFRRDNAFRPYAGMGVGFLDSERVSEFPNYVIQHGGGIVSAPPDIYRYHTTEFALGFATGFDARVWKQLSILGDLSLDLSNPSALSSARLTAGAGWNF